MLNPTYKDLEHAQGRASAFRHIAIFMGQKIGRDDALKFVRQAREGHITGKVSSTFRAAVEDAYVSMESDLEAILESM